MNNYLSFNLTGKRFFPICDIDPFDDFLFIRGKTLLAIITHF